MNALAQPLDLPPGFTARPFSAADAAEFTQVYAAAELADTGEAAIEEADFISSWSRPSLNLERDTVAVFDARGRMVAGSDVSEGHRADGAVHPDARGQGLGTALAQWTTRVARAAGQSFVAMSIPAGSPGEAVFAGLGYRRDYTSWVLRLPEQTSVPPRALPPGYAIRQADSSELPTVFEVIRDAFAEWRDQSSETYADWYATGPDRPGFEPWMIRVATDPDSRMVGACTLLVNEQTAFVSELAVRRDQRRQGLAQALLADGFGEGRRQGAPTAELATDSRTGALDLYQGLGMRVAHTWNSWRLDLPTAR